MNVYDLAEQVARGAKRQGYLAAVLQSLVDPSKSPNTFHELSQKMGEAFEDASRLKVEVSLVEAREMVDPWEL